MCNHVYVKLIHSHLQVAASKPRNLEHYHKHAYYLIDGMHGNTHYKNKNEARPDHRLTLEAVYIP